MVTTVNFRIDDQTYRDYQKILIDRNKSVSEDLREHIFKVVADSKKPTVY